MHDVRVSDELRKLLGSDKVVTDEQHLLTYASDMIPEGQLRKLADQLPPRKPLAICFAEDVEDIRRVVRFCAQERVPVIPWGAGSGVCGSSVPVEDSIALDVKRMNRITSLVPDECRVTVQPGLIGEELEERLNAQGMTMGHFPSSIACSTVGGYVACRSAGQFSSRYGKIEDMLLGLEVVLPNGDIARLGVLGDGHYRDPLLALIAGSEGTLGVITEVCLKVEPLPEKMDFCGYAFLDLEDGLQCMRRVMQSDLRPTVLRLYDPLDSLMAGFHSKTSTGEDIHRAAAKFRGLKATVAAAVTELNAKGLAVGLFRPSLLNRVVELLPTRSLLIAGVQGSNAEVAEQWDRFSTIAESAHGEDLGPEPGHSWYKRRYAISYKQSKIYQAGAFLDTMEVATTWENLGPMYRAIVRALSKHVFIMAHFSHAYPQGCSVYFTFAAYRPTDRARKSTYQRAWRAGLEAVQRYNGTISHHHGIGTLKKWAMTRESPGGQELFQAFKRALDEASIMNPGKIYNIDA
jgi:alkyldihydroxyacetonephosphate synthase